MNIQEVWENTDGQNLLKTLEGEDQNQCSWQEVFKGYSQKT